MDGYSEKSREAAEGRAGQRAARGTGAGERGDRQSPPLDPFRQPGIPPEAEREVQERAWKRIRGEVARLEKRDRQVAEREQKVRQEQAASAHRGHWVIPDPEGDTPPTYREARSLFEKKARREGDDGGHAQAKRRRMEERGAGGAAGAPRPTSHSPETLETDLGSESPLPRHCARHCTRREEGTVRGWRVEEVAE